jgi:hypothetical protein
MVEQQYSLWLCSPIVVAGVEQEEKASNSQQRRVPITREQELIVYPCASESVTVQGQIRQAETGGIAQYASWQASYPAMLHVFQVLPPRMQSNLDSSGKLPELEAR